MKRVLGFAAALIAGLSGCTSPARYVEKGPDSGIVAIPVNSDNWPYHYRREAEALIEEHVGPGYVIVDEKEVTVGQSVTNNQQTNTEKTLNPTFPLLTGEKQTTNTTTSTKDITEYRIAYRRGTGTAPSQVQTQYPGLPTSGVTPAGLQTPAVPQTPNR